MRNTTTMIPAPCPTVPGYGFCDGTGTDSKTQNILFLVLFGASLLALCCSPLLIKGMQKCRSMCAERGLFGSASTRENAELLEAHAAVTLV